MKEQILELRAQGKTYSQIVEIVGCSKSTVAYHCNPKVKEKTNKRNREYEGKAISNKIYGFRTLNDREAVINRLSTQCARFTTKDCEKISYKDIVNKFGEVTQCYLTGREINLTECNTYHFDHIIPVSQGGLGTLDNLGIACPDANQAKGGLMLEDFYNLCEEILVHKGYKVEKPI